jgi:hypothetical protein
MLPKMLVVAAMLAAFGHFGLGLCAALFREAIAAMPLLVRG